MSERYQVGEHVEVSQPEDDGRVVRWHSGIVVGYQLGDPDTELLQVRRDADQRLVVYDLYYAGHLVRPKGVIETIAALGAP